jgi:hypothetical protein
MHRTSLKNLEGHSGDSGVECWIMKCSLEHRSVGIRWIHVVWDRDKKRAVVSTVMHLRVPCNAKNVVTEWGGGLLAS